MSVLLRETEDRHVGAVALPGRPVGEQNGERRAGWPLRARGILVGLLWGLHGGAGCPRSAAAAGGGGAVTCEVRQAGGGRVLCAAAWRRRRRSVRGDIIK